MPTRILSLVIVGVLALSSCRKNEELAGKKILNWVISDDVRSFDPALNSDLIAYTVVPLAVESLYQYAYRQVPAVVEPLVADGFPMVSADQLTYTIRIKKGVLFHDDPCFADGKGRALKAQDFVFGWKRLFHPRLAAKRALFEGRIVGLDEFKKRLAAAPAEKFDEVFASDVEGLSALDEHTIRIKLTGKYPHLTKMLALMPAAPVPFEAVKRYGHEGLSEHLIGTGPYALKTAVRGSQIVLKKNLSFRGETHLPENETPSARKLAQVGSTLPHLDEIHFQIVREETTAWLNFRKGNVDVYGLPKSEDDSTFRGNELDPELQKKGMKAKPVQELIVNALAFNMKDKLLGQNVDLRRAIGHAIDRDQWIQVLQGGRATKATGLIPPGMEGRPERKSLAWDYDLAEAKRLLAKAGYPDGKGLPVIRFDTSPPSSSNRQTGEFIAASLKKIGIRVEVVLNTIPAFMTKMDQGNLELFEGGWMASYPDAENFLKFGHSKQSGAIHWTNAEYDRLFEKIFVMKPSPERVRMIAQAEQILLNDAPLLPLFYRQTMTMRQSWVRNYWPENRLAFNFIKYLDVDLEEKSRLLATTF